MESRRRQSHSLATISSSVHVPATRQDGPPVCVSFCMRCHGRCSYPGVVHGRPHHQAVHTGECTILLSCSAYLTLSQLDLVCDTVIPVPSRHPQAPNHRDACVLPLHHAQSCRFTPPFGRHTREREGKHENGHLCVDMFKCDHPNMCMARHAGWVQAGAEEGCPGLHLKRHRETHRVERERAHVIVRTTGAHLGHTLGAHCALRHDNTLLIDTMLRYCSANAHCNLPTVRVVQFPPWEPPRVSVATVGTASGVSSHCADR